MAGLLDEPYIGYPQLRRSQSLLGGTPRGLLNTTPQISAETLRKLGEQLINIPTSATRAITDPQLFARILGITPNQQLSGFSAGYAGLPAKPPSDIGVVDPLNREYSKGYSSGEEMGMMTALAAPLAPLARPVGRAMGEQAYRMTEDMLQRQGLMPSIVPRKQAVEKGINNQEVFNPNISFDEFKSLAEKGQMRQARTFDQDVKDVINKKMPANIFELTGKNAYDYESGNFVKKLEKAGLYVDDDRLGTVIAGKTKKDVETLKEAQSPIEYGLSFGYKPEDIAKFYVNRRGNQADIGYAEFLDDLNYLNQRSTK